MIRKDEQYPILTEDEEEYLMVLMDNLAWFCSLHNRVQCNCPLAEDVRKTGWMHDHQYPCVWRIVVDLIAVINRINYHPLIDDNEQE